MKISTKGRYAVRLMYDLAMHHTGDWIALKDISRRQEISVKYLEQIVRQLSIRGYLKSLRGPKGGYQLSRDPKDYTIYEADKDATYESIIDIDLSEIRPTVAFPHLPGNAHTIDEIEAEEPIYVDQVVIGSCTNGRISDLRKAAAILKGHTVAENVRVMVVPATQCGLCFQYT